MNFEAGLWLLCTASVGFFGLGAFAYWLKDRARWRREKRERDAIARYMREYYKGGKE